MLCELLIMVVIGCSQPDFIEPDPGPAPQIEQLTPRAEVRFIKSIEPPEPPPEPEPEPVQAAPAPTNTGLSGDRLMIADCESGDRRADGSAVPHSYNWTGINQQGSSASGAFQFLDGTWDWVWRDLIGEPPPTARARDATPEQQIRAFDALWDNGRGASHWKPSRSCWG